MPSPTRTARGIRLREQALTLMAEAIGDGAYYNGRPNYSILTGSNRTGTATRLMRREPLSIESFTTVTQRYADASGLDFWQAAEAMFEPVDADGAPLAAARKAVAA